MVRNKERWARYLFLFFALLTPLVVVTAVLYPYNQLLHSDELSLHNPLYMFAHYGQLVYPIHHNFDAMVIHPPLVYYIHGFFYKIFGKVNFSVAGTHALVVISSLLIIHRIRISNIWKLATAGTIIFVTTEFYTNIPIRPLLPLSIWWFTGWLCIEAGRQTRWKPSYLAIGSLLIGLAAVAHYSAAFSVVGLLVYVWLLFDKRELHNSIRLGAYLLLPAAIVVTAYFAYNVIPNLRLVIHSITGASSTGVLADNIRNHYLLYDVAPASVFALVLMAGHSKMRWMAVAALPVWLFTLFTVYQKYDYWYTELLMFYFVLLVLLFRFLPVWTWLIPCFVIVGNVPEKLSALKTPLSPDNAQLARACAKDMNGANAKIGSRMDLWYISGGEHWLNVLPDLYWKDTVTDEAFRKYAQHFDVLVDHKHMSDNTLNYNGKTMNNWYAESAIYLSGFYLIRDNSVVSDANMLFLSPTKRSSIQGYSYINGELLRYVTAESGSYMFFSIIMPYTAADSFYMLYTSAPLEKHAISFERTGCVQIRAKVYKDALLYGVLPKDTLSRLLEQYPFARLVDTVRLHAEKADADALIQKHIINEPRIKFYKNFEDWQAGRTYYR